jgi:hypothetical protein
LNTQRGGDVGAVVERILLLRHPWFTWWGKVNPARENATATVPSSASSFVLAFPAPWSDPWGGDNRRRRDNMNIEIEERTGPAPTAAASEPSKLHKKPSPSLKSGRVEKKGKPTKKAKSASKSPKKSHKTKSGRFSSKTKKILHLLKRPGGVTAKELRKVTGWLSHSVRGFLSGKVGGKMGLTVTSIKSEDGERRYSVKA